MKGFLISLLLFSILVTGIFWNGRYLRGVGDALSDTLGRCIVEITTDKGEPETALNSLSALWKEHRGRIGITVPVKPIREIDDALLAADTALKSGNTALFTEACARLRECFSALRRYETPSLGSILRVFERIR